VFEGYAYVEVVQVISGCGFAVMWRVGHLQE